MSSRERKASLYWLGTGLIVIGGILLGIVVAYYAYTKYWDIRLSSLVESLPSPTSVAQTMPVESTQIPSTINNPGVTEATKESNPVTAVKEIEKKQTPTPEFKAKVIPETKSYFPPATRIVIPDIGVDSKVDELGTKYDEKGELVWETPCYAVGHYKGTANPGEDGNIVMSGHISSPLTHCGSVFKQLTELKLGDPILLHTEEGAYLYKVVETKITLPEDTSVMESTPDAVLTLITCYPDWVYKYRWIVIAKPYFSNHPLQPEEELYQ